MDDILSSLMNSSVKEDEIRQKIADELANDAKELRDHGKFSMASGVDFAYYRVLGLSLDINKATVLDDLLSDVKLESQPMPNTDAMGREKFWEDLGRPDGQ